MIDKLADGTVLGFVCFILIMVVLLKASHEFVVKLTTSVMIDFINYLKDSVFSFKTPPPGVNISPDEYYAGFMENFKKEHLEHKISDSVFYGGYIHSLTYNGLYIYKLYKVTNNNDTLLAVMLYYPDIDRLTINTMNITNESLYNIIKKFYTRKEKNE